MTMSLKYDTELKTAVETEAKDASTNYEDVKSVSLDESLLVEKEESEVDTATYSIDSLRREMNDHVHAAEHEKDSFLTSYERLDRKTETSATDDQSTSLLHLQSTCDVRTNNESSKSCNSEINDNAEFNTKHTNTADSAIAGKASDGKSNIDIPTPRQLSVTSNTSLVSSTSGKMVKRRYIRKAVRNSLIDREKKRRSSSWSDSSPGFGSIDLIVNLNENKKNSPKRSMKRYFL